MKTQHAFQSNLTGDSASLGKPLFGIPFLIGSWLFVACLLLQMFTVGMSVFINPSWWATHAQFARIISPLALILFLVAWFGRFPRSIWGFTGLLNVLLFIQFSTIHLSAVPSLTLSAALHPVNAFLIFGTALAIAWQTGRQVMGSNHTHP